MISTSVFLLLANFIDIGIVRFFSYYLINALINRIHRDTTWVWTQVSTERFQTEL